MVGVISAFVVPPFQMREVSTKPGKLQSKRKSHFNDVFIVFQAWNDYIPLALLHHKRFLNVISADHYKIRRAGERQSGSGVIAFLQSDLSIQVIK